MSTNSGMDIGHAAVGGILGFLLLGMPLALMGSSFSVITGGSTALWGVAVGVVIGIVIGAFCKTPGKVLRRVLITGAVLLLILPLASCIGGVASVTSKTTDATTTGVAAIGIGLGSMFIGFFAFLLAMAYLVIGLLVGRDKPAPTVIIQPPTNVPPAQ